jgi:hypothetical protein
MPRRARMHTGFSLPHKSQYRAHQISIITNAEREWAKAKAGPPGQSAARLHGVVCDTIILVIIISFVQVLQQELSTAGRTRFPLHNLIKYAKPNFFAQRREHGLQPAAAARVLPAAAAVLHSFGCCIFYSSTTTPTSLLSFVT